LWLTVLLFPVPRDVGDDARFRRFFWPLAVLRVSAPPCQVLLFRLRAMSAMTRDSGDSSGLWLFSVPPCQVLLFPITRDVGDHGDSGDSSGLWLFSASPCLRVRFCFSDYARCRRSRRFRRFLRPSACVPQPWPPPPIELC
jgi:hypothetical protein